MYINNHTYYSLKYGTISPQELVREMLHHNVSHFALTDINNTSALLEVLRLSRDEEITIIAGVDFRNGAQQQFIALAKNNFGWKEINDYLSKSLHSHQEIEHRAPAFKNAYVIYPLGSIEITQLKPHEFVGIRPSQINTLRLTNLKKHTDKLVILHPITFRNKRDFNAHRLLRAIANNTLLSQLPKTEEAQPNEVFLTPKELLYAF